MVICLLELILGQHRLDCRIYETFLKENLEENNK